MFIKRVEVWKNLTKLSSVLDLCGVQEPLFQTNTNMCNDWLWRWNTIRLKRNPIVIVPSIENEAN